jgi:hypothetical protein
LRCPGSRPGTRRDAGTTPRSSCHGSTCRPSTDRCAGSTAPSERARHRPARRAPLSFIRLSCECPRPFTLGPTYLPSLFVKIGRCRYNGCVGEIGSWFSSLVVLSSPSLWLAVGSRARPWRA